MSFVDENDGILKKLTPQVEKFEEIINNVTTSQVSFTYYQPKKKLKTNTQLLSKFKLLNNIFYKSYFKL